MFEMDLGDWEGRTQTEIRQMERKRFEQFWRNPEGYRPVTGEGFLDVEKRAVSFLSRSTAEYEIESVLIVSHAIFLKVLLSKIR
ncbi:hypothetical protein GCM10007416_04980 [Kroppenstedtia guangzhouensis]|uniref:Histidine phosphatase superfamily (Branch 1) n=1 Tax=Kroppenstedtia guangzhouensis TaxID=1274356 RepID=A0ABQ1G161_9BACL|nr:hypothetical protein GCM10007416_04980 [Kroppenstedtia guangzhouensis]